MGENTDIAYLIVMLILMICAFPILKIVEFLYPEHGADVTLAIMLGAFVAYIAITNICF